MVKLAIVGVLLATLLAQSVNAFNATDILCKVNFVMYDEKGQTQDHSFFLCETLVETSMTSIGTFSLDVDPASRLAGVIGILHTYDNLYIAFPPTRVTYPSSMNPTVLIGPGDSVEIVPPADVLPYVQRRMRKMRGTTNDHVSKTATIRGGASQNDRRTLFSSLPLSSGPKSAIVVRVRAKNRVPEICHWSASPAGYGAVYCTGYNSYYAYSDVSESTHTSEYASTFSDLLANTNGCSGGNFQINVTRILAVTLDRNISSYNYVSIYLEAKRKVNELLGFPLGADPIVELNGTANFIMYHVPRGMPTDSKIDFSAGALGGTFSIYQDSSFLRTIMMHELGHNMGLNHARENLLDSLDGDTTEDVEYGDDSGLMGTSLDGSDIILADPNGNWVYYNVDSRCYNSFNYYSLGWFKGITREITSLNVTGDYKYIRMTNNFGYLQSANAKPGFYGIVKIGDLFVMVGENRFAGEYRGQLVITQAERHPTKGTYTGRTDVRAVLEYATANKTKFVYGDIVIEVCDRNFLSYYTIYNEFGGLQAGDGSTDFGLVIGKGVGCEKVPKRCNVNPDTCVQVRKTPYVCVYCYELDPKHCSGQDWNAGSTSKIWEKCPAHCPVQSVCPALSIL